MRPPLLPLALALLAASPLGAEEGSPVTADAGSSVILPCDLPGPGLVWRWRPRYPRCAGVSGGISTLYTETGAETLPLQRFQGRLLMGLGPQISGLHLVSAHVSDSGVFSCATRTQAGPNVSVTITPGCQAGASVKVTPDEPPWKGASVSLSCHPCGAPGPTASTARGVTWLLNGAPPPDLTDIRELRDKVTIKYFSSRFEGLWSCRLPGDPPRTGSYCLERPSPGPQEPPSPGTQGSPSPGPTQSGTLWGCLAVALVLILTGALAFVCWRRRRAGHISESRPAPRDEGGQDAAAPPMGLSPPAPDPQTAGEGPDGMQYSTLRFQEPGGAVGGGGTDPPTVYAQLAPAPGGRG